MDVEPTFLDMDTAIPLGMIVNEIVSNSFKHAFKPHFYTCNYVFSSKSVLGLSENNFKREKEIYVNLRLDDKKLTLIIGDNGIGFPRNINFRETDSLGMQLITTLTSQINGDIELDRSKGTKFKKILK